MYKEYYELHKNDEYIDDYSLFKSWTSNEDLYNATIDSIKDLDKEQCINYIQQIRASIIEKTSSLYEFLNLATYLIDSVNNNDENALDYIIFKTIMTLLNQELWFYYKEPFENCLNRLGSQFDIEFK